MTKGSGSREGVDNAPLPSKAEKDHANKVAKLKEELPYPAPNTSSN